MDLIKLSAKVKERLEAAHSQQDESKTYRLPTDRVVRRANDRAYASSLRKEQQRGRRAHVKAQQAAHIAAAQPKESI